MIRRSGQVGPSSVALFHHQHVCNKRRQRASPRPLIRNGLIFPRARAVLDSAGPGVSHLLRGLARIVQHPKEYRVYWVRLLWSLFLFLYLIHFWWWEFRLRQVTEWTFPLYFFVAIYTTLMYLLCTLLFPEEMADYKGFQDYFYSRKRWIFSLMALLFLVDVGDTLLKGLPYFEALGPVYYLRTFSCLLLSLLAIKLDNRQFHSFFVVFALLCELIFILTAHLTMG